MLPFEMEINFEVAKGPHFVLRLMLLVLKLYIKKTLIFDTCH